MIVVGAGPVGLTAALRLALAGVPVTVLEQEPFAKTDWRASTFHCATLEVLEPTGIVPDMLAHGLEAPTYQLRDRHRPGPVAEFHFAMLADDTAYPFRLQLNQQHVVQLLLRRLAQPDLAPRAEVRFGHRLVGLKQDPAGVTARAEVAAGDGQGTPRTERFRGAFLFGADGASSTVRKLLDVTFDGMTYPERFIIISIGEDLFESIPDLCYVNYCADPQEWVFLLRTPESWRALFPVPADERDAVALSDERVQERLQEVAARPHPYTVLDRQIYGVHQRVARTFREGRVLLMGDAAHVNSPIGGVGLNSGIHDASDAAVRVARILEGETDLSAELRGYDGIRRRVALDYVQRDTHANTLRLKETDAERRYHELAEIAAIAADPGRAKAYLRRATLLGPLRLWGIGRAGPSASGETASSDTPGGDRP